jgi:hypothetical protein
MLIVLLMMHWKEYTNRMERHKIPGKECGTLKRIQNGPNNET